MNPLRVKYELDRQLDSSTETQRQGSGISPAVSPRFSFMAAQEVWRPIRRCRLQGAGEEKPRVHFGPFDSMDPSLGPKGPSDLARDPCRRPMKGSPSCAVKAWDVTAWCWTRCPWQHGAAGQALVQRSWRLRRYGHSDREEVMSGSAPEGIMSR